MDEVDEECDKYDETVVVHEQSQQVNDEMDYHIAYHEHQLIMREDEQDDQMITDDELATRVDLDDEERLQQLLYDEMVQIDLDDEGQDELIIHILTDDMVEME